MVPMLKEEIKKVILQYFKEKNIPFRYLNEENRPIKIESLDTLYLFTEIPEIFSGCVETCVRFKDEYLYCQSYYGQPVVHNKEEAIRAARIINYLNMHLSYDCNSLYEHTFIMDETDGDVFNGCMMRYEIFSQHFQESMNHILNYSVQQILDVYKPIFYYVHRAWDYHRATKVAIDQELMGKKG